MRAGVERVRGEWLKAKGECIEEYISKGENTLTEGN